ncbi:vesicle-associated membrane protein synaptobrevin isoform X2 [Lycorma delicatula]|uniref:vesicle-associated membrane protein synaptobrevin isoform X2 n=1 Tax=Lycorma delicatula TaxID=130591 RepID=UPI003F510B0C
MDGGSSYSGDLGGSRLQYDNKRIMDSQAQVNEVVGIMRVNVEKVLERDQKLSELDSRADQLQQGASQFEQGAARLKRKMWWQNVKMMIIIGIIGGVMLLILLAWIISEFGNDDSSKP